MMLVNQVKMCVIAPIILLLCCASPYGHDRQFASAPSVAAIPFELVNNHIYLRVSVNDSAPLSFVLDTGANVHLLNLRLAKSLGLKLEPLRGKLVGVGANVPDFYFVPEPVSIRLPGVTLDEQILLATSLDPSPGCEDKEERAPSAAPNDKSAASGEMNGVLGKALFDKFVVEIDYAARLLRLYDPRTWQYKGNGTSLPLVFKQDMTLIQAKIKAPGKRPVKVRLFVDTGAASALTINQSFAAAHQLLPPVEKRTVTNECGVGGAAEGLSFEAALEDLQLGNLHLAHPLTFFRKNAVGQGYDGLLGGAALRNFKVIFDYAHRQMILEQPR